MTRASGRALAPNVLGPGVIYQFRLTVTDKALRRAEVDPDYGFADVTFEMKGMPPSGGEMSVLAQPITRSPLNTSPPA